MDSILLVGTEAVEKAGYAMRDAAQQFGQNVGWMTEALQAHERFLEQWLQDLREVIDAARGKPCSE